VKPAARKDESCLARELEPLRGPAIAHYATDSRSARLAARAAHPLYKKIIEVPMV